jgi:ABC-type uncharacterized transport system substrate-binding protein
MKLTALFILLLLLVACTDEAEEHPLRIGVLTPLSGNAAVFGTSFLAGANQAVEDINKDGLKVELIVEDNKNDGKEAVSAYQRLKLKNPDVIISTLGAATVPVTPLVKADGTPLIITYAATPSQLQYENSFYYFFNNEDNAEAFIPFLKEKNAKTVAIYHITSETGLLEAAVIEKRVSEAGFEVVAKEAFLPTETDHKTGLLKIAAAKPDVVYITAIRPDQVAPDAKKILNNSIIVFDEVFLIGHMYKSPAFDGVYATVLSATLDNDFEGGDPYSIFAYDAVKLAYDESQDGTEKLIPNIVALGRYSGRAGDIIIKSATRDIDVGMEVVIVQNGTLVRRK